MTMKVSSATETVCAVVRHP